MSGWRRHTGKEIPVHHSTVVDVRFRNKVYSTQAVKASVWVTCWVWKGVTRAYDIIAYRIVQP